MLVILVPDTQQGTVKKIRSSKDITEWVYTDNHMKLLLIAY